MVFSSLYFLFFFLPITFGAYFLVPEKWKNAVLLAASIFFYAWGEPIYVGLMLFSAAFNYLVGLDMDRKSGRERKALLIFAVIVNLFLLGFFKYYGFCIDTVNGIFHTSIPLRKLGLPIGISFYTFQSLSYLIDVYRGSVKVQRNLMNFALYLTMFPQLIAGPIVKYSDIEAQLKHRTISLPSFGSGASRFLFGLSKKVLLANNLGMLYSQVQALEERTVVIAWIGIFAYTLQIYFDFSGYSDMAIGLGKMFGFSFQENFKYPYTARTVTDFWHRWHISLSSWFRDYVYIPLGGNRVKTWKHVRNILIVWMLTGLWHGANWNFVIWGLYYGGLLLAEKYLLQPVLDKIPAGVTRVGTFFLVMVGWVFFSHTDLSAGLSYLGNLIGIHSAGFADLTAVSLIRSYGILLVIGAIVCGPLPMKKMKEMETSRPLGVAAVSTGLFVLCTAYLIYSSYNPFLYFRF